MEEANLTWGTGRHISQRHVWPEVELWRNTKSKIVFEEGGSGHISRQKEKKSLRLKQILILGEKDRRPRWLGDNEQGWDWYKTQAEKSEGGRVFGAL